MPRIARFALAALSFAAASAHADFSASSSIYYLGSIPNDPTNPDLRVMLYSGYPNYVWQSPMCGTGTPNWAYLSSTDPNYAATVQILTNAMHDRRSVDIFSVPVTAGNPAATYCKITYVRSYAY